MPLHQNQDGTWQWGKSGKKYKKKEDAIKQMKAIFANGYVQKHATLNGTAYSDINNKGSLYMTYTDVYNLIKRAAFQYSKQDVAQANADPSAMLNPTWKPYAIQQVPGVPNKNYTKPDGTRIWDILKMPIGRFKRGSKSQLLYKDPNSADWIQTNKNQINRVMKNYKTLGNLQRFGDFL